MKKSLYLMVARKVEMLFFPMIMPLKINLKKSLSLNWIFFIIFDMQEKSNKNFHCTCVYIWQSSKGVKFNRQHSSWHSWAGIACWWFKTQESRPRLEEFTNTPELLQLLLLSSLCISVSTSLPPIKNSPIKSSSRILSWSVRWSLIKRS